MVPSSQVVHGDKQFKQLLEEAYVPFGHVEEHFFATESNFKDPEQLRQLLLFAPEQVAQVESQLLH